MFQIRTDLLVSLTDLTDASDDTAVTGATVTMSLYEKAPLNVVSGAAVSAVQRLVPNVAATAGTFTISFAGEATGAIAYGASAATIQTAIRALTESECDAVTVVGSALSTSPVGNGLSVTWPITAGNVPLLTVNTSGLTGTTAVSVSSLIVGQRSGVARDAGGGTVGIPVEANGRVAGDYVYLIGTKNYDGEETIVSASRDEIVITASYVAETFTGNEEVFLGIAGTGLPAIALADDGGGDYSAVLPDTLQGFSRNKRCMLVVTAAKGSSNLVVVKKGVSGFYEG